jgi:hypothetical protein
MRARAQASKASQAQSKAKMIEKLRSEQVEAPTASSALGAGDAKKVGWLPSSFFTVLSSAPPCPRAPRALVIPCA